MKITMNIEFGSVEEMLALFRGTPVAATVQPATPAPLLLSEGVVEAPRGRGRPRKEVAVPVAVQEVAPETPAAPLVEIAPATPEQAATPAVPLAEEPVAQSAVSKEPTKEQIVLALSNFRNRHGRDTVIALLQKFGGENSLSSVPEKNWMELYREAKAGC